MIRYERVSRLGGKRQSNNSDQCGGYEERPVSSCITDQCLVFVNQPPCFPWPETWCKAQKIVQIPKSSAAVTMVGATNLIFIIAEVQNQYRTLAAVDIGWLCESEPLERCLQVLCRLQANSNRVAITQELRAAARKGADFWTRNEYKAFPYLATCLLVGSLFDLVKGYRGRVYPLSFNATSVLYRPEGRMGYTVIDSSDVENIRYCFIFAKTRATLFNRKPQVSVCGSIVVIAMGTNLTTVTTPKMINHSWSNACRFRSITVHKSSVLKPITSSASRRCITGSCGRRKESDDDKNDAVEQSTGARSLRSQLLDRVLDRLVFNPFDNLEILDRAPESFDLPSELSSKIASVGPYRNYDVTSSPALMSCFAFAFAHESTVDLSPYTIMPAVSLVAVALKLLANGQVRSLNISGLHQLSEGDVQCICYPDFNL